MRNITLAVTISTVLMMGAVAAHSDPATTSPAPTAQTPAATPTSPSPGEPEGKKSVGAGKSNGDEPSSSGAYYPYSAGTVGDDPAKPTSTTLPANSGPAPEDAVRARWMNADSDSDESLSKEEFQRAEPTLTASFDSIDVDGDSKLSRDELRSWHESQKARMDADQARTGPTAEKPATTKPEPQGQ
jgi:hypothetical protein